MAVKQIVKNAFEQILETSKDSAKSSLKQVGETLNPWDMIKNSFLETKDPQSGELQKAKEQLGKNKNSTPLDFDNLQKKYADQDKQKVEVMKNRLFQMVKGEDEKIMQKKKQEKLQKEREEVGAIEEKKRKAQNGPVKGEAQGKEQKSIFGGKKRKKTQAEPQPAELKPGGGKQ